MNAKDRLIQELEQTPDFLIEEVLNFLLFLKNRILQKFQPTAKAPTEAESTGERLLSWADELTSEASTEDWKSLPTDFSQNLDHYLYGSPKAESEPHLQTQAAELP